jgi:hypothetical protein
VLGWFAKLAGARVAVALAGALAAGVALAVAVAPAGAAGSDWADWTAVSNNAAAGTLLGNSITLSGTHVSDPPGSTVNGTSRLFSSAQFTPSLPTSDAIEIRASSPAFAYTIQFGAPIQNPILDIGSLGSALQFPPGTAITRVSGTSGFAVSGATVTGAANNDVDPSGENDSYGTVMLRGTFQTIAFTAAYPGLDGVYIQVGATAPPPPLPTTPSGGTPPPPPAVTQLAPISARTGGSSMLVSAKIFGAVNRIAWDVNGDGKPDVVGSGAQTTLRFRPPAGKTVITATPIGPGGTGAPVSTTVIAPVAKTSVPRAVLTKIAKLPGVFAVGPTASFLGKTCAGNVTVRSGALEVTGCLHPIASLADIPAVELPAVQRMTKFIGLKGSKIKPSTTVVNLLDGYITYPGRQASVNGLALTPIAGAAVLVYPQANLLSSSAADASVGGIKLAIPVTGHRSFLLNTAAVNGEIPLGGFLRAGGVSSLAGFALAGAGVDVTLVSPNGLTPASARITATLRLPHFLQLAGSNATGQVTFRATTNDGLILDKMRIGPLSASVGGLSVQGLQLDYSQAGDIWQGQGKLCLPSGTCLNMIPPNGGISIAAGAFQKAGATLFFNPAVPLFPGVDLHHIGFTVALDPTRFFSNAGITAAGEYQLDGNLLVAFPSDRTPFILRPNEVGGFPANLYGQSHTGFTIAANANASIDVPVVGRMSLGNGYFLYEAPSRVSAGRVSFGGGVDENFAGVFSITGRVDGDFNADNGAFNLLGTVQACLTKFFCRGADGFVSSAGAAACIHVGPLSFGVGVHFRPFWIKPWPVDGCKWSPFRDTRSGHAALAAAPYIVHIKQGDRSRVIQFDGTDGAPVVSVTGPDGQNLTGTDTTVFDHSGAVRIMRLPDSNVTAVGLQDPRPGTYRIETVTGSPVVSATAEATDPPAAHVTATVRGTGIKRTLAYDVLRRPAQKVTFSELTANGSVRTIGSVTGGGTGTLHFHPSVGVRTSHVVAQFTLDGLPAERLTVASFSPLRPRLPRPNEVRIVRHRTSLTATWRPVAGATRYEVVVNASDGTQRLARTRGHAIVIDHVVPSSAGTLTVRAIDTLRTGPTAMATFRRTAAPKTRFSDLPRRRR